MDFPLMNDFSILNTNSGIFELSYDEFNGCKYFEWTSHVYFTFSFGSIVFMVKDGLMEGQLFNLFASNKFVKIYRVAG